jgi:hypothetical protein
LNDSAIIKDVANDDWATNVINLSKVGTDLLLKGENLLKYSPFDRQSRHQKIVDGAEGAVDFIKMFSAAAAQVGQIIDQHVKWIDHISYSYEIKGIDFDNGCINLHFERYFGKEKEPFTLVYDKKNVSRPWGYYVVHGDLLVNTGMSNHYLEGIKDVLDIFIESNKFEDLIEKHRIAKDEKEKKHRYDFCRKHFDVEIIRDSKDRIKLYRLLDDPEFYKILKENKLTEIIDSYRLFLKAKTTRKAELRLKHLISEACNIHEMPKPPGYFCKAKETLEMNCRSGIYFGWRESQCFYVGKSKNIASRLKSHHVINLDDDVSWLEFPESDIHLNELFYIWLLAPECNSEQILKEKTKAKKEQHS